MPVNIELLLTANDAHYDLPADDRISPSLFLIFEYPTSRYAMQVIEI